VVQTPPVAEFHVQKDALAGQIHADVLVESYHVGAAAQGFEDGDLAGDEAEEGGGLVPESDGFACQDLGGGLDTVNLVELWSCLVVAATLHSGDFSKGAFGDEFEGLVVGSGPWKWRTWEDMVGGGACWAEGWRIYTAWLLVSMAGCRWGVNGGGE
jgi:hypothetical protein